MASNVAVSNSGRSMKRFRALILWLLAAGICAGIGRLRLEFDVDILSLLPSHVSAVKSLRTLKDDFEAHSELLLMLEDKDGADLTSLMPTWLAKLQGKSADWSVRQLGATDPLRGGALLAWAMENAEPGRLSGWLEPFKTAEATAKRLDDLVEKLATSPDIAEVQRLSYDPLGITELVGAESLGAAMEADGVRSQSNRVLLAVKPARTLAGYEEAGRWLDSFHLVFDQEFAGLKKQHAVLQVHQTGDIAFMVEAGRGMQKDLSSVLSVSLLLIVLLFGFMYRTVMPLLWITLILLIVMGLSLGAGALVLGKISAMNLGFTAIVLGLVVDYGVILLQDSAGLTATELRRHATRGILGAAASTAAVFLLLLLSSFPGLRELGILVAIGVTFGALVMLTAFPPLIAGGVPMVESTIIWRKVCTLPSLHPRVWGGLWLIGLFAVLFEFGPPPFEGSAAPLRPKNSPAMDAMDHIESVALGAQSQRQPLLIHAGDVQEYRKLSALLTALPTGSFWLPDLFLPVPLHQEENRAGLNRLLADQKALKAAVLAAGFTEDSLVLADGVFAGLEKDLATPSPLNPHQSAAAEDLQRMVKMDANTFAALGWITPKAAASLPEPHPGIHLPAWESLGPELAATAWRDGITWMLPLSLLFLVALYFVFKNWRDVGLAASALAMGFLTLLALMAVTHQTWNLASIAAVPLLMGTGIDYSIHILLALRRPEVDAVSVRRTTGRAILFCALSSAIGFGSLTLAGNGGISSLGAACALGLASMMLVSLVLLPEWGISSREDQPSSAV